MHWETYAAWRRMSEPVPQRLALLRGAESHYYGPQYDRIEILSPTATRVADCNAAGDWNDASYVLRVWHGNRSIMLPGDAGQSVWDELADLENLGMLSLKTDVLVASHHGRRSGYPGNGVLARIAPKAVIVSTDKIPRQHSAIPWYAQYVGADNWFSTRWHGNLRIRFNDAEQIEVSNETSVLATYGTSAAAHFGYGLRTGY